MEHSETDINNKLKLRFWIFFSCALVFIIWMKSYLSPLQSGEIVQYEMAKTTATAAALIQQWTENGKLAIVLKSIYIDYVFIIIYCLAISTGCRYTSSLTKNDILIKAGVFFSYFIFVAGIFDIIENISMMKGLLQAVSYGNVDLAYKMAISKFSIILMTLFFIAVCLMFWLMSFISRKEKAWKRV
jgi:hypothetical protein